MVDAFYSNKMSWLSTQVDVEFPTPESIKGRDIYLAQSEPTIEQLLLMESTVNSTVTIMPVTEHRLTIRWAMVVASQWQNKPDQFEYVLEFLTQIELSNQYQLYLALDGLTPIAACLSQVVEGELYCSDIEVKEKDLLSHNQFLSEVARQESERLSIGLSSIHVY